MNLTLMIKWKMLGSVLFTFTILTSCIVNAQTVDWEPTQYNTDAGQSMPAEIGTVSVLEHRDRPDGKKIELSFLRLKSTASQPGSPIVYLAGGPGGSGIRAGVGRRSPLFMKLREVADVILLDQRGVGKSNPLPKCKIYEDFPVGKPISKKEYVVKTTNHIEKCLEFYKEEGHDLTAYNTTQNALDIEDVRKALGVEKISILGTSYGSHLAFEYIRLFENRVDKLVLSALEGPDEAIKEPRHTDNFVKDMCHMVKEQYPDLWEKIKTVHERVEKQPVLTSFRDKKGREVMVGISAFELRGAITNMYLKNPRDVKKLPALYQNLYNGDFSEIAPIIARMKRYAGAFRPMSFAMDMSSGISYKRRAKINKQNEKSLYKTSLSFLFFDWMHSIDFPQLSDEFRELKSNRVDALLLSGDMDGRTYLTSAKKIAKKFKKGKHVVVKNAGHDLFMSSPKIMTMILGFYKGEKECKSKIVLDTILFN